MILDIYVPRDGGSAAKTVLPGSAIVGGGFPADGGGRVLVDYEGDRYGSAGLALYNDRLKHAAGRHAKRYPTIARALFERDDLVKVGAYDAARWAVVSIDDPAAAEAWSGETVESIVGKRLPCGQTSWREAAALTGQNSGAQPLAGNRPAAGMMWFRTRAGQVIGFGEASVAIVYDHDSPVMRGLLGPHLRPEEASKVFGD